MVVVELKDDGRVVLVGDFVFYASPQIFDPITFTPRKKISFGLGMELTQDMKAYYQASVTDEEIREKLGQKLKEDFIKALKDGFKNDPSYPEKEYK